MVNPLLKLILCDNTSCWVIRIAKINQIWCLFWQCRCEIVFLCTRHVNNIAPCLSLWIVNASASCHNITVNIYRVNRVTYSNNTVCRKDFLNISAVTLCTVRNKYFIDIYMAASVLIFLCNGAAKKLIAKIWCITVESLCMTHLLYCLMCSFDNGWCNRLCYITDS